jgi:actin-like ATPase involved in cell morphogenesis
MNYRLGIDLGTVYTAAAVLEQDEPRMVGLGARAAEVPSVLFLAPDGSVLVGEAASRHAPFEPGRVAREFKQRIGNPTPLVIGGTAYTAEVLAAKMLRWVVDHVEELQGGRAQRIVITHPASWGPYKRDLLRQAVRTVGIEGSADEAVLMLTEPEAAATAYTAAQRLERGDVVAVYDLGGATFDTAVLRKRGSSFDLLGLPQGIDRVGGLDFDELILQRVDQELDGALARLDLSDLDAMASVARLRQECVEAKEALSKDTEVSIPVLLPDRRVEVGLTRDEFEALIRPKILFTIETLRHVLSTATLSPDDVRVVLLVGGSSRIPLVAEMVSAELCRPVAVHSHPEHAIALGAARAAVFGAPVSRVSPPPSTQTRPVSSRRPIVLAALAASVFSPAGKERSAGTGNLPSATGRVDTQRATRGRIGLAAAGALLLLALFLLLARGERDALSARIIGITVEGPQYVVDWEPVGFTPDLRGTHVHFFFDTVPPDQAGWPGRGPWWEKGPSRPFTGFGVADRPPDASAICGLVANPDHTVQPGSGGCAPLP